MTGFSTTRRDAVSMGAAALGLGLGLAAPAEGKSSVRPKPDAKAKGGDSGEYLPIICLEEHVNDPAVAAAIRPAMAQNVGYLQNLGQKYRENPPEDGDRPALTFVLDTVRIASGPLVDRVAAMDRAKIDFQVISLSNATQLAPDGDVVAVARAANDRLAQAKRDFPSRLSAFFTLPWQDAAAAVAEAERCVRQLGLPATMLTGRPAGNDFIDHPRFEPILAKLAELGAPVYIHPGPPVEAVRQPYYTGFNPDLTTRLSLFGWGWHHEAGIQVIRLILSGAFDRHRGLKVISGHWGEMVPFYLQRMDDTMPPQVTGLSRTISQTYRDQVWIGPSGMLDTPHFNFVKEVLGIDRLVFSIDYPYLTMGGARRWLEGLAITRSEREAFAFRNAKQLLGLT